MAEPVSNKPHRFDAYDGASGHTCTRMVIEDGDGVECGLPPEHPLHHATALNEVDLDDVLRNVESVEDQQAIRDFAEFAAPLVWDVPPTCRLCKRQTLHDSRICTPCVATEETP